MITAGCRAINIPETVSLDGLIIIIEMRPRARFDHAPSGALNDDVFAVESCPLQEHRTRGLCAPPPLMVRAIPNEQLIMVIPPPTTHPPIRFQDVVMSNGYPRHIYLYSYTEEGSSSSFSRRAVNEEWESEEREKLIK